MGTAWDVANAALFLASDEANFITRVSLFVDGGGAAGKTIALGLFLILALSAYQKRPQPLSKLGPFLI
jgi:hypothetical protein